MRSGDVIQTTLTECDGQRNSRERKAKQDSWLETEFYLYGPHFVAGNIFVK